MDIKLKDFIDTIIKEENIFHNPVHHLMKMDRESEISIIALNNGVVSGISVLQFINKEYGLTFYIKVINGDGSYVEKGDLIALISGNATKILQVKILFNKILNHMSTVASTINQLVEQLDNTRTKVLDNRYLIPGSSYIEQLAYLDGNAVNNVFDLQVQPLITLDDIKLLTSDKTNFDIFNKTIDQYPNIQVEVNSFKDFQTFVEKKCKIIHLCNMSYDIIAKCMEHSSKTLVVVPYKSDIDVNRLAQLGVHFISVSYRQLPLITMQYKLKINI
jgi:nicotinate-nucleotide pyrophosphorylase (carboxylating)